MWEEGSLTSMLNIQFKAKLTSKLSTGQRAAIDKLEGLQKIAAITEIVSYLYFLYCQIVMCDHALATAAADEPRRIGLLDYTAA